MSEPHITVTVDGVPVAGVFFERLISLSITDRDGIQSDRLDMTFNDAPPHFLSPRRGAVVVVSIIAKDGSAFLGTYVIDSVELSCFPHTIKVGGHSADLRSNMKTARSKHWDNASVRDIVSEKARDFGTNAKISDAVSGHVYDWIGQVDETDLAFLKRLAERHDALFTVKGGVLLWLQRGAGKTADGHAMPPVVIRDTDIVPGTCKVAKSDVDQFGKVKAFWQDRAGAKRREVIVDGVPDAQGEHVLRDPFASEAEARSAAESAAAEMMRGQTTTHCTVSGMPALMAGGPVFYAGVRPGIDGRIFILDTVNHSFNKSDGLRSKISGKLKVAS